MTFTLSARAELELDGIVAESAGQFGAVQAAPYAAGLRKKLAMLAENPGIARARAEMVGGARAYRYKAHMIVYREEEGGILVIRLPHARSDWINELD